MLNTFKVYFYVFIRPIIKTLLKQSDIRKFSFYQVSQDVNWRHLKAWLASNVVCLAQLRYLHLKLSVPINQSTSPNLSLQGEEIKV